MGGVESGALAQGRVMFVAKRMTFLLYQIFGKSSDFQLRTFTSAWDAVTVAEQRAGVHIQEDSK